MRKCFVFSSCVCLCVCVCVCVCVLVLFCFCCWFLYSATRDSGGVLWFHVGRPSVCPSVRLSFVRPSVFLFPDDNLSKL